MFSDPQICLCPPSVFILVSLLSPVPVCLVCLPLCLAACLSVCLLVTQYFRRKPTPSVEKPPMISQHLCIALFIGYSRTASVPTFRIHSTCTAKNHHQNFTIAEKGQKHFSPRHSFASKETFSFIHRSLSLLFN